jgi:hypothetical protein
MMMGLLKKYGPVKALEEILKEKKQDNKNDNNIN